MQVWGVPSDGAKAEELASGVVVGDGLHVLTLLDYVKYSPSPLEVASDGSARRAATIEAIDPRTGITLLALQGEKMPAASVGQTPAEGQSVEVWERDGSRWKAKYQLQAITNPHMLPASLFFGAYTDPVSGPVFGSGTVVTGPGGKVVGLALPMQAGLAMRTAIPSPLFARCDVAMQTLTPPSITDWTTGPALTALGEHGMIRGDFAGVLDQSTNYAGMTAALAGIFSKLGDPVSYSDITIQPLGSDFDSTIFVAVYPRPVGLTSKGGEVLATAKWVGIQWGRGIGKPDRLVYGSKPYVINGAYEILSGVDDLKAALPSVK